MKACVTHCELDMHVYIYINTYINIYMCVCVGEMSSVGGYCSELRSIATITATMLPVSPFTAIRGVCVWECVCEQWFYTHTHTLAQQPTHSQCHSVCVFNGKHNARKEGKVPAQIACDENVQQPCPTTPLPTCALLS